MMEFNDQKIIEALQQAVTEVYEGMTFAEVEACNQIEQLKDLAPTDFYSTLELKSPFSTTISLVINGGFLTETLEMTLDDDQNTNSDKLAGDLISEYINTVAGLFANKLLPADKEFELSLPTFGKGQDNPRPFNLNKNDIILDFMVEFSHIYCIYHKN